MSYILTNENAINFFKSHPHLDFNETINNFIIIMQKLTDDSSKNTSIDLLQSVSGQLKSLETSFTGMKENIVSQANSNKEMLGRIINSHIQSIIENMRETIKSNNMDSEKTIIQTVKESNDFFYNKIISLIDSKDLQLLFVKELGTMQEVVKEESKKIHTVMGNQDLAKIQEELNNIIIHKYQKLDKTFSSRLDTFFSSQNVSTNNTYTQLLSKLEKQGAAVEVVGDYFSKQMGSTTKGNIGEQKLELLLSKLFPSGDIKNTSGLTASGDFIIERKGKPKLLIDTKDYETVVPIKEVEKIIRDIEKHDCNGLLLSQNSGIAQKNDFEINIHNNKIIIFIHNVQYDGEKIMLACNILDHLTPILEEQNIEDTEHISSQMLSQINKEYQELASQKLNLINTIKKQQSDVIDQIYKIDIPTLTTYLTNKFANTGKTVFGCEICNVFIGKNAKSLAAHQRSCKKTINLNTIIN